LTGSLHINVLYRSVIELASGERFFDHSVRNECFPPRLRFSVRYEIEGI
jgi:hypothetical protein